MQHSPTNACHETIGGFDDLVDHEVFRSVRRARRPALLRITSVNLAGRPAKRLMFVFRTNGCRYARETGGCVMCGFRAHTISPTSLRISSDHLMSQFDCAVRAGFLRSAAIGEIDLLTPGSFLDDQEVPSEFRIEVMRRVAHMQAIKKIVVETRCEFVTEQGLAELTQQLRPDQQLEVSFGVESSNHFVRNRVLNKGLPWQMLRTTVAKCARHHVSVQFYILVKPHCLTEGQAIADAVTTAEDVVSIAQRYGASYRLAFEPVFVARGTEVERVYEKGRYTPVNLWSLVAIIRNTARFGNILVGLCDENTSGGRMCASCPQCTSALLSAIERFNGSQDLPEFLGLSCSCRLKWLDLIRPDLPQLRRAWRSHSRWLSREAICCSKATGNARVKKPIQ